MRIVQRTHLLQIGSEQPLNPRIVSKVYGLHFSAKTAFVDDFRLTGKTCVSIPAHREGDDFVEPRSGVAKQLQYGFLTEREGFAVDQSVKYSMHPFAHIRQFFP